MSTPVVPAPADDVVIETLCADARQIEQRLQRAAVSGDWPQTQTANDALGSWCRRLSALEPSPAQAVRLHDCALALQQSHQRAIAAVTASRQQALDQLQGIVRGDRAVAAYEATGSAH